MNEKIAAKELVAVARELTGAPESKYDNPIDQWLSENGWTETHGIGLYTNPRFPLVGVDTNSGEAAVNAYESKSDIFNDEGSFIEYTDNIGKIKKAVKEGAVVGQLFSVLRKKYPRHTAFMPTSSISFHANRDDDVSFTVYTDNWTVVVGQKFGSPQIKKKMTPNVRSIVRFIEDAQQEILAGGER